MSYAGCQARSEGSGREASQKMGAVRIALPTAAPPLWAQPRRFAGDCISTGRVPHPHPPALGTRHPRHAPPVHRLDRHQRPEHAVADLAEDEAARAAAPLDGVAHRPSVNLRQWLAQYSGSRSGSTGTHHEHAPRCCSG